MATLILDNMILTMAVPAVCRELENMFCVFFLHFFFKAVKYLIKPWDVVMSVSFFYKWTYQTGNTPCPTAMGQESHEHTDLTASVQIQCMEKLSSFGFRWATGITNLATVSHVWHQGFVWWFRWFGCLSLCLEKQ